MHVSGGASSRQRVGDWPAPLRPAHRPPPGRRRGARRAATCVLAAPPAPDAARREAAGAASEAAAPAPAPHGGPPAWLSWEATWGWASSVWGVLRVDRYLWGARPAAQILGDTTERAVQAGQEQQQEAREADVKAPPPDIRRFLQRVGVLEIRYTRMLAHLCSITYDMQKATATTLFRLHGLRLVTTSLVYERMAKEPPRSVHQAFDEADGMAPSPQMVAGAYTELLSGGSSAKPLPAMQAIEKLRQREPLQRMPSPTELVATRIAGAAAAAATAAAPLASGLSSAAAGITAAPLQALGAQLQAAAAIGQSTALATIATVAAALESVWGAREVTQKQAVSSSYWFVADDATAHTRYFAIQGSNNMDHWRINLQFDPVPFEDPALGLKVHRGFYEAAQVLYDNFLPLVEQHLASSPFAKIVFTGHSLGGSVGTLLMLMFLHRKVIPPLALGPVYTFGAPGIFCEDGVPGLPGGAGGPGILARLGLNAGAVRNVMMHRDLVPRAFACDYALVADLLARVSESFRTLESLRHGPRNAMYYPIGRTLVLQPDESHAFIHGAADHPLLPPGANFFALREQWGLADAADQLGRQLSNNIQPAAAISGGARGAAGDAGPAAEPAPPPPQPRVTGEANLGEDGGNIDDAGPDKAGGPRLGAAATSVQAAFAALMDLPHPLDILSEPGSYGNNGAISRYHDPVHYVRALGGVLRARTRGWRPGQAAAAAAGPSLPQLHHIEAPAGRSRKARNTPPATSDRRRFAAAAGR